VQTQSINAGCIYNFDTTRLDSFLYQNLQIQYFRNCPRCEPVVLYTFRNPYPTMGLIRLDVCDNGHEVIDTIAVDNGTPGRAMRVRLVGTRAEMQYLIHIPDSVRRLRG